MKEPSLISTIPTRSQNPQDLGKLRSDITVEVHTYEAISLLTGAKKPSDNDGVTTENQSEKKRTFTAHNLTMLAQSMMLLEGDIRHDNPYADYWFDVIYQRITSVREHIRTTTEVMNNYMKDKLPANFKASVPTSIKPVTYTVRTGSSLYFQFLYAVMEADEFIRLVKLCHHIMIIKPQVHREYVQSVMTELRSAISQAASYRHYEVTRNDVAANNARARQAEAKYTAIKIVPTPDHFRGTVRNEMAPEIYTVKDLAQSEPAMGYEETTIVEQAPTKSAEDKTAAA